MSGVESEELKNLQTEFEWILRDEIHIFLQQLRQILIECACRFPIPVYKNEGKKTEKYLLVAPQDQIKCSLTLTGDCIVQADVSFKLKKTPNQFQRTALTADAPWKLQQIQDAANHLRSALIQIDSIDRLYCFKSAEEVIKVSGDLLGALQRGRTSLTVPKRKPLDELIKGRNMKSLVPNLPDDQAISFFFQGHKIILAVYQLTSKRGSVIFDSNQAEFSVPWLNEVLLLFTAGLKLCQQLKANISHFTSDKYS